MPAAVLARCPRDARAVFAAVFPLKTNEKSTFWLLVPTRCLKKASKTNEKSTFLLLGPGATILGTKKVPLKPILFQHFGFGGVLGVSWGRLGPSWGVLIFKKVKVKVPDDIWPLSPNDSRPTVGAAQPDVEPREQVMIVSKEYAASCIKATIMIRENWLKN